jgi:hypothetical protein
MKNFNLTKLINAIITTNLFIKGGSTVLFVLSIVIAWQLMNHGQLALGVYMLIEKLHAKLHRHDNHDETGGSNAAEHAIHIVSHSTKLH